MWNHQYLTTLQASTACYKDRVNIRVTGPVDVRGNCWRCSTANNLLLKNIEVAQVMNSMTSLGTPNECLCGPSLLNRLIKEGRRRLTCLEVVNHFLVFSSDIARICDYVTSPWPLADFDSNFLAVSH
jgi:hypothetical protein